ncbi:MAG: hypothetical protein ACKPKO_41410, partial [Candidatus Fonsibacter sp.]
MKAMKATRVSRFAKGKFAKRVVFNGNKDNTYTGLQKSDITKSKSGNIVTRKQHAAGMKAYAYIKAWADAVQKPRKEFGVRGLAAVKQGVALYKAAKA